MDSKLMTIVVYQDGAMVGQVNRMVRRGCRHWTCTIGGERHILGNPWDQPHVNLTGYPLPKDLDTEGY